MVGPVYKHSTISLGIIPLIFFWLVMFAFILGLCAPRNWLLNFYTVSDMGFILWNVLSLGQPFVSHSHKPFATFIQAHLAIRTNSRQKVLCLDCCSNSYTGIVARLQRRMIQGITPIVESSEFLLHQISRSSKRCPQNESQFQLFLPLLSVSILPT